MRERDETEKRARRKEKVYPGNETPQLDGGVLGTERVQLDAGYISNGNSKQETGKTQRIHESESEAALEQQRLGVWRGGDGEARLVDHVEGLDGVLVLDD
jgi:hypothetical protein